MIKYLNTRDYSVLESTKTQNSNFFAKFNQISPECPLKKKKIVINTIHIYSLGPFSLYIWGMHFLTIPEQLF